MKTQQYESASKWKIEAKWNEMREREREKKKMMMVNVLWATVQKEQ